MYVQGFEIWLQLISEIFPELAERTFFASDDDEFTNMTRYDVLEKDSDDSKAFTNTVVLLGVLFS